MRNIHMMLPPAYRDLWKGEFSSLKKLDVNENRAWMYEADPFTTKLEHDEAQATKAKKREEQTQSKDTHKEKVDLKMPVPERGLDRGWARVPKVEMGSKTRLIVENLVKREAAWNSYGVQIPEKERKSIVQDLLTAGFRQSHVEEAVLDCKDREEVLEWLLIHVPEDDLPQWTFPEGYMAGISLASNDLVRESKLKRLAETGYSRTDCARALDDARGDESIAAEALQNELLHNDGGLQPSSSTHENTDTDLWAEEQATLEAIFGERYSAPSPKMCQIRVDSISGWEPFIFRFSRPRQSYPVVVPVLALSSKGLPAYIRLSIVRQALQFAIENLLNDSMIFNLVDWLEVNVSRIIESPGRLRGMSIPTTNVSSSNSTVKSFEGDRGPHRRKITTLDLRPGSSQSSALKSSAHQRQSTPSYQSMLRSRASLPAWAVKDSLVTTVRNHAVTIISGETGSGKSTQSVQFILDDMISRDLGSAANIICTQPRRISALGLADRVSDERCSIVGEEVGYSIRGDSKTKLGVTKITFMTTGVLLRRLQSARSTGNDSSTAIANVSHVFVDEVHERSLDTDFLLALLRDALKVRKDLKVVLMSATLDSNLFADYFGGQYHVGKVEIEGRTFPIQNLFLDDVIRETGFNAPAPSRGQVYDEDEDSDALIGRAVRDLGMGINYNLIASTVSYIDDQLGDEPGAVLIFLPGTLEIDRCLAALRSIRNIHALALHASLQPAEQRQVFKPAPRPLRKVIAATNVAETSITIADVVAVIDTGRVKETSFDPKDNMVKLQEVWASQAACKQRRGRAGRVSAGTCYKLFTRASEARMAERPEPEIRRIPLEQLCLSVKGMGMDDVEGFLARTLSPPEDLAVSGALRLLHRMGALEDDHLTALGRHLAMIPADLRCAKLLVYGAIFGCLESCLTIASILTVKSPFVAPLNKREEAKAARKGFAEGDGDLLTDLEAYNRWSEKRQTCSYAQLRGWCSQHFLSQKTLESLAENRAQYLSSLVEIGFLPRSYHSSQDSSFNRHSNSTSLLRALIAGAFSPQVAEISFPEKKFAAAMSGAVELDPEARTIKFFNQDSGRVFVHPGSVMFDAQSFIGNSEFMSYFTKMATNKVFMRDLTRKVAPVPFLDSADSALAFNAYSLLLFSGPITLDTRGRGLVIDGWLRLRGPLRIGVLASRLRTMLDRILAKSIECPGGNMTDSEVVEVVRRLVEWNGLDH
jgi:ATP-dependent RNA helicase DHX57